MAWAAVQSSTYCKYAICSSGIGFVYGALRYKRKPDLLCDRIMAGVGVAIVSPVYMPLAVASILRSAEASFRGVEVEEGFFESMSNLYLGKAVQPKQEHGSSKTTDSLSGSGCAG